MRCRLADCRRSQSGVTLIELLIGMAVIAIALNFALPSYATWIQNLQIRNAAQSILNGLQLARAEALRRNTFVQFALTDATGLASWSVRADDPSVAGLAYTLAVQARSAQEGSSNARIATTTAGPQTGATTAAALAAGSGLGAAVDFNALGRVTGATPVTRIDVFNPSYTGSRRLVILVSAGGQVRMCDPALGGTNPQRCI